jgi:hypothetical protein
MIFPFYSVLDLPLVGDYLDPFTRHRRSRCCAPASPPRRVRSFTHRFIWAPRSARVFTRRMGIFKWLSLRRYEERAEGRSLRVARPRSGCGSRPTSSTMRAPRARPGRPRRRSGCRPTGRRSTAACSTTAPRTGPRVLLLTSTPAVQPCSALACLFSCTYVDLPV